jgi:uncharacterized membrane protein
MSEMQVQPPAGQPGRGLKIALALSLALNLAIAGVVAGAVLGRGMDGGGEHAMSLRTIGLGPFAVALDREDRAALRERLVQSRPAIAAEGRDLGRAYRALQIALRADPFDRTAAEAALSRTRARVTAVQEDGHRALLDMIDTMNAQDRTALADRLDRPLRRVPPRDRDD